MFRALANYRAESDGSLLELDGTAGGLQVVVFVVGVVAATSLLSGSDGSERGVITVFFFFSFFLYS